jgi:hypothetical protein
VATPACWTYGCLIGTRSAVRLRSDSMDERYGLMLVPSHDSGQSVDDVVAQRQRDGWQLVSTRIDSEGGEVMVFRRPA